MKITLPKASSLPNTKIVAQNKINLKAEVERFINGKLKNEIVTTTYHSVNTALPIEAYEDLDGFVKICKDILTPLGYEADRSHDGGGMYDTLCVTWKKD